MNKLVTCYLYKMSCLLCKKWIQVEILYCTTYEGRTQYCIVQPMKEGRNTVLYNL